MNTASTATVRIGREYFAELTTDELFGLLDACGIKLDEARPPAREPRAMRVQLSTRHALDITLIACTAPNFKEAFWSALVQASASGWFLVAADRGLVPSS